MSVIEFYISVKIKSLICSAEWKYKKCIKEIKFVYVRAYFYSKLWWGNERKINHKAPSSFQIIYRIRLWNINIHSTLVSRLIQSSVELSMWKAVLVLFPNQLCVIFLAQINILRLTKTRVLLKVSSAIHLFSNNLQVAERIK